MKTYSVSLLIHSSPLSLDDLSLKLGRSHTGGSHTKGEPHVLKDRPPWSKTVWRLDSRVSKTSRLKDHLEDLKIQFPPGELRALLPADCSLCIDIAIFFDSVNVSASIPRSGLKIIDAYDTDLEVTCYPSSARSEKKRKKT
jgi:hypothetical protein